jgi:hypothetical protein
MNMPDRERLRAAASSGDGMLRPCGIGLCDEPGVVIGLVAAPLVMGIGERALPENRSALVLPMVSSW